MEPDVIEVTDLAKTYSVGMLRRRRVVAVDHISFSVKRREVFGFLGPNGAGKTTTIRMLMGLISPSAGTARLFGHAIGSRQARTRLGFLPESPYFYDYLTVGELLDLTGRLFGMGHAARAARATELIDMVGLGQARTKRLKAYSKGMLQRAGVAQALMNDPELVVLDEPMSGLDPIGRKEVRDIIFALRDAGKTVFFSSHILADVEMIADRLAILVRGKLRGVGTLSELVRDSLQRTDVVVRLPEAIADDKLAELEKDALSARRRERELMVSLAASADVDAFLARARDADARVVSVVPHRETLEDVFIREAGTA